MSCCTLKRSRMDLDPLIVSPRLAAKRQRLPITITSPTNSMNMAIQQQQQKLIFSTSPFSDANVPQITSDLIACSIRDEMKRFQRRRQLRFDTSSSSASIPSTSSTTSLTGTSDHLNNNGRISPSKDKPLFTFEQVGKICERMLDDREKELRESYEKVLTTKLDEQYDTFVKFTHEQLQTQHRPAATSGNPSYLS